MVRILQLHEMEKSEFPADEIDDELAGYLCSCYNKYVRVTDPVPRMGKGWTLYPQGYAGILPLPGGGRIVIAPKTPARNFFAMLATAYRIDIDSFRDKASWEACDELFEALLLLLAEHTLRRARRGLHREYVGRRDDLPFVRGRLAVSQMMTRPLSIRPICHYSEHTADNMDNRIVSWALHLARRSGLCTQRSRAKVQQACRTLAGTALTVPVGVQDCTGRTYTRLNSDYALMHGLSRFVIENTAHSHREGHVEAAPFVLDTARLFEMFVAEWIRLHLPDDLELRCQDTFRLSPDTEESGRIDIVVIDARTGSTRLVLDTKYKATDKPSPEDIHQAVTYSVARRCNEAVLVYPTCSTTSGRTVFSHNGIRVRMASFPLDNDLDASGFELLHTLGIDPSSGH